MPEFFSSFPSANIKPVEFKAADLINIGRQGIAYQTENQANNERIATQKFFANPDNFQSNGMIDMDKINRAIPEIAPLTGRDILKNMAELSTAQTQATAAKQNLTTSQKEMVGKGFAGLVTAGVKDKEPFIQLMNDFKEQYSDNPNMIKLMDSYLTTWNKLPQGTDYARVAATGAMTLLPQEQTRSMGPQLGTMTDAIGTYNTFTQPPILGVTPGSTVVASQPFIQPTTTAVGQNDVTGNPTQTTSRGGNIIQSPLLTSGAVPRIPPGENQATYSEAINERVALLKSAAEAQQSISNYNQIVDLSKQILTGAGSKSLSDISNVLGASGSIKTNRDLMGHLLALQKTQVANAGLNSTDAGKQIAGEMTGNIEFTPDALRRTAQLNRSLATATQLLSQGVESTFQRTKDPIAAREFKNKAWPKLLGNNGFDAIRLYDAFSNNDSQAAQDIIRQYGGANSDRFKALKEKLNQINSMIGE